MNYEFEPMHEGGIAKLPDGVVEKYNEKIKKHDGLEKSVDLTKGIIEVRAHKGLSPKCQK